MQRLRAPAHSLAAITFFCSARIKRFVRFREVLAAMYHTFLYDMEREHSFDLLHFDLYSSRGLNA